MKQNIGQSKDSDPVVPSLYLDVTCRDIKHATQINNKLSLGGDSVFVVEIDQRFCLWAAARWESCHCFEVDLEKRLGLDKDQQPTVTLATPVSVVTGRFSD